MAMKIRVRDHGYYQCVPLTDDPATVCDVCAWQILHEFGHSNPGKKHDKCQYCQRLPWTIVTRNWESKDERERDPLYRKYQQLRKGGLLITS